MRDIGAEARFTRSRRYSGPLVVAGISGMFWFILALRASVPEDCGTLYLPTSGTTQLIYDPKAHVWPQHTCTLTPLASYRMRKYYIRPKDRPCTAAHLAQAYPSPACERGDEMLARVLRHVRARPGAGWNVTVQALCCPVSGENGARHASAQIGHDDEL